MGTAKTYVVIKKGSIGEAVKKLQEMLNTESGEGRITEDGIFGTETDRAVRRAQQSAGMEPNGIVEGRVWEAIGKRRRKRGN